VTAVEVTPHLRSNSRVDQLSFFAPCILRYDNYSPLAIFGRLFEYQAPEPTADWTFNLGRLSVVMRICEKEFADHWNIAEFSVHIMILA